MSRQTSLLPLVLGTSLYGLAAITALGPVTENDTWWHLRTGQWIVAQGTVPATDPFSAFGAGKPWVAYSWLCSLLFYGLTQLFGLTGLVLYRVVMSLAITAALHRLVARRQANLLLRVGVVAAAVVALTPLLVSERPGLFTILFATLTLDAILCLREGRRAWVVWLLPLCYALWANLHIQFVHGLFLLGLACLAPLIDRFLGLGQRGDQAATWETRGWWRLVGLCAACFLATLLNPYHVRIYSLVATLGGEKETHALFSEMHALDFRQVSDWAVLGLAAAAAYTLGRRPQRSAFDYLLLAAGAYFSFHAKHDLWFVVLAAVALVAGLPVATVAEASVKLTWPQRLAGAVAVALLLLVAARGRQVSEDRLQAAVAEEFPAAAVEVIRENGYTGPLYNHYDWGGYLLWRLPEVPAAIDGRTCIHGDQRYRHYADTWEGQPGWEADAELNAAQLVVLQRQAPLAALLRQDAHWTLAHEDALAVVFIRRKG